jgi:hypothetical protein
MAKNVTDSEFVPHDVGEPLTVVELFVVVKMSNGDCKLVETTADIDGLIFDIIAHKCVDKKGNLILTPSEVPNFVHRDGRRFW